MVRMSAEASNLRRADRNYCYANDVIVRAAVEAEVKIGSRKQLSFVWHKAHSVHAARWAMAFYGTRKNFHGTPKETLKCFT